MSHPHPSQGFALTSQELDDFHERGIAGPFRLYDPQEMDASLRRLRPRLLNARQAIYKGDEAVSGVTNISNYDRHFDVPFLAEHICRHEIVDRLASIIGHDIICWRTEFFPKYPGDEGTDWHQAGTFANVATSKKPQIVWPEGSGGRGTLTVWTAFTESSVENGCLQVIPGSHRTIYYDENKVMEYDAGRINKVDKGGTRRGFFGYDYRQLQVDPDWRPDESQAVSLVMRPGEFVIFWSTLLHASHPHAGMTKNMRLGFSARYVPASVRVYPYSSSLDEFGGKANLDNYRAVLVSGKDEYGHNPLATHTGDGELFQHRPGLAHAPLEHER
jgi:non-heme Fe2+,alpha-ketoglutarate-dependent halogenase